jgi:hypothetical protein
MRQTNGAMPIVFVLVADPVGAGFVESLARPGGNATGFTAFEYTIGGKWLELLREIAPQVRRKRPRGRPLPASSSSCRLGCHWEAEAGTWPAILHRARCADRVWEGCVLAGHFAVFGAWAGRCHAKNRVKSHARACHCHSNRRSSGAGSLRSLSTT